MAFGAHADDLELDIGGTLFKYHDRGYAIRYVMTTNNMSGQWARLLPDGRVDRRRPPFGEMMPQRKLEAAAGARALGTEPIHLDYLQRHYVRPDGVMEVLNYGTQWPEGIAPGTPTILAAHEDPEAVTRVAEMILGARPEAVLSHGHLGDNLEHIGSCLLVTKAYRQAAESGYTGALLYWHDIAAMTFRANYCRWDTHVDVSAEWERKLALIALHECQKPQVEKLDFPPWGAACGCRHAEVFDIAAEGTPPLYYTEFLAEIFHNRR